MQDVVVEEALRNGISDFGDRFGTLVFVRSPKPLIELGDRYKRGSFATG